MANYNVGLVGAGTVGAGVVKILHRQGDFFADDLRLSVALKRIADKNTAVFNDLPVGSALVSANADDIIKDDDINVVIELVGGTTFAKDLVLSAIAAGKHVVTANKALIAEHGPVIFEAAEKNGVSVYFEAAVGGGMPVIKSIREAMIGNDIQSIKTIINGTCNYILTKMEQDELSFDEALSRAQKNGFAEADPTLDIEGGDTGHKVAIMASLINGGYVPYEDIAIQGITQITAEDIAFAKDLGYRIKLLGIIKATDNVRELEVRVQPTMLRHSHILASVANEFNSVLLEGDAVGEILLYGKGAGQMPTASAVVGDVIDVLRNIKSGEPKRIPMGFYSSAAKINVLPSAQTVTRYYLRFTVQDKPKVLAPIAAALGDNNISIASVLQKENGDNKQVPVIILTHSAKEENLQNAMAKIEKMNFVKDTTQIIRIEED